MKKITDEGTFPGAARRLTKDFSHFVVLDETSNGLEKSSSPICCSTRVVPVIVDFRHTLRNARKIQVKSYRTEIYPSDRSDID